MGREDSEQDAVYKRYIIDDGWNLPIEVIELIDLCVEVAWDDAYRNVCKEHDRHRGGWLTEDIAKRYELMAWIWLIVEDYQYIGKVREIGEELQQKYGVTEVEAINIINGYHIKDYVNKYYRIQHRIPQMVNAQAICNEVVEQCLIAI